METNRAWSRQGRSGKLTFRTAARSCRWFEAVRLFRRLRTWCALHFFNTDFRPEKFPMDMAMFTGRVPLEELKIERPRYYAELMAGHITVACENAHLYTKAITDGLTGLYARSHLDTCLLELRPPGQGGLQKASLFMIDLDSFKAINDTSGHAVGDRVLKTMAQCVGGVLRDSDLAFRYGGDEFCVMLGDTASATAIQVATRLRDTVRECDFGPEIPAGLSISIGVACCPEHGEEGVALLKRADEALYQAKKSGKDRVVLAEDGSRA